MNGTSGTHGAHAKADRKKGGGWRDLEWRVRMRGWLARVAKSVADKRREVGRRVAGGEWRVVGGGSDARPHRSSGARTRPARGRPAITRTLDVGSPNRSPTSGDSAVCGSASLPMKTDSIQLGITLFLLLTSAGSSSELSRPRRSPAFRRDRANSATSVPIDAPGRHRSPAFP